MTRQAQQSGDGWVGNGVDVSTIKRAYDDFLAGQARTASAAYEQSNTYATQAERVSNMFGRLDDRPVRVAAEVRQRVAERRGHADLDSGAPDAAERGADAGQTACKSYRRAAWTSFDTR